MPSPISRKYVLSASGMVEKAIDTVSYSSGQLSRGQAEYREEHPFFEHDFVAREKLTGVSWNEQFVEAIEDWLKANCEGSWYVDYVGQHHAWAEGRDAGNAYPLVFIIIDQEPDRQKFKETWGDFFKPLLFEEPEKKSQWDLAKARGMGLIPETEISCEAWLEKAYGDLLNDEWNTPIVKEDIGPPLSSVPTEIKDQMMRQYEDSLEEGQVDVINFCYSEIKRSGQGSSCVYVAIRPVRNAFLEVWGEHFNEDPKVPGLFYGPRFDDLQLNPEVPPAYHQYVTGETSHGEALRAVGCENPQQFLPENRKSIEYHFDGPFVEDLLMLKMTL